MTNAPTFGVGLPQAPEPGGSPPDLPGFAARAEALGFDTLWAFELPNAPAVDPLALLAHTAALTRRARLGVAVLVTGLRIPLQLARDLASVDVLSGGRLTVGVGLGGSAKPYPRHGLSPHQRLRRHVEGLDLVRRLWTQDELTFENEWWRLEGPTNVVPPVQRPHPPIWIGAHAEPPIARAIRTAEGWIGAGSASPESFRASLEFATRELEASGRDPATFTIGKRVYLHVTGDEAASRPRVREWFAASYRDAGLADRVALIGSADACTERLRELIEGGVQHLLLNPVIDDREQLEILAEEVVPELGRLAAR
jgi:alkanesulfonate monooxygenase SsuD/methylene tetrahydromethanopterin reductase-like flavin-dependent oxidoreductase (luciferase family)